MSVGVVIHSMRQFASMLRRDLAAVHNAIVTLSEPHKRQCDSRLARRELLMGQSKDPWRRVATVSAEWKHELPG